MNAHENHFMLQRSRDKKAQTQIWVLCTLDISRSSLWQYTVSSQNFSEEVEHKLAVLHIRLERHTVIEVASTFSCVQTFHTEYLKELREGFPRVHEARSVATTTDKFSEYYNLRLEWSTQES